MEKVTIPIELAKKLYDATTNDHIWGDIRIELITVLKPQLESFKPGDRIQCPHCNALLLLVRKEKP